VPNKRKNKADENRLEHFLSPVRMTNRNGDYYVQCLMELLEPFGSHNSWTNEDVSGVLTFDPCFAELLQSNQSCGGRRRSDIFSGPKGWPPVAIPSYLSAIHVIVPSFEPAVGFHES
jgi:hypothetical protein